MAVQRLRSYEALGALVALAGVVALLAVREVPRWLIPIGVLPGLLYYLASSSRERLRQRLAQRPFPLSWRQTLVRRVPLYRLLSVEESGRFEREIQFFLAEQRIYPLPGSRMWQQRADWLTDEHKVLIAASAATLLLGRPEWRLPTVRDIVVYPAPFSEESYEVGSSGHTLGMVHAQGPILLSLPALLRAYPLGGEQDPADEGQHVGLHEFAHVLDFIGADGQPHGVPDLLSPGQRERWREQLRIERERLMAGHSVLHPYGLKNDAELFAVSVESFFMSPLKLRTLHPALYDLLADLFNQDPAARLLPAQAPWLLTPWFAPSIRYQA